MSYTVPSTATYQAANGSRRRFISGEVIDSHLAYLFGMPGSVAPSTVAEISAAEQTEIQALIDAAVATAIAAVADGQAFTGLVSSTVGVQVTATARTATAAGLTTGTIADGTSFVTVTSDSADKIIILPTPTPGAEVTLANGATGYELRSSAPATVAINGGAEAEAESAIAANQLVHCRCRIATAWICNQYGTDGTESKVDAAAAA